MSMKSMEAGADDEGTRPRICAIFPGALGDFICFMPTLQALGRKGRVDLLARREFGDLVPDGVTVSSLEGWAISGLFLESARSADAEKFFRAYDAVYSWFASGNEGFVQRLKAITDGRAHLFPFRSLGAKMHQADYYIRCLGDRPADANVPRVELRPEALQWREKFWLDHALVGRPILTIAPGSGAREKNWPEEFYCAVALGWREATGGAAIVLSGPVERERGGVALLRESCLVASGLTLSQAAALLSRSDVYLGNDSGISHLAAALGTRTVSLFGPTDPARWAPRGKKVTVLRRGIECSPCPEMVMKSCPHRVCLTELRPQEIISRLARLPEVVTLTR
jgi:ADP-heptose:LPS heptosyltransferase